MNGNWKTNPIVAIVWTVLRIWLGVQWLTGGIHKVADGFDATGFLQGAIAKVGGENPTVQGWYGTFLENVALPNAGLFSFMVKWGEVLVGVGLILGVATTIALLAAAFMNLNFLLAGTLSTNPVVYTAALILLFAGAGAYYYGGDRYIKPYLKNRFGNGKEKHEIIQSKAAKI